MHDGTFSRAAASSVGRACGASTITSPRAQSMKIPRMPSSRTGSVARIDTAPGAHTTALVPPDRLYVFAPADGAALVLTDA
jgi:hypothetical protein